jgi:hypothetical protein
MTMTTMMMTTADPLAGAGEVPREAEVEALVRGVREVDEGALRMRVGRGDLEMVCLSRYYLAATDEQMMETPGLVHVGDKRWSGLLALPLRMPEGHSIPVLSPKGRHAVSL